MASSLAILMSCSLSVQAWDGPSAVELLRRDYPLQDVWLFIEREVPAGTIDARFIITIDAVLADGQDGDASIDDLKESIYKNKDL